jgi:hypothetical protein
MEETELKAPGGARAEVEWGDQQRGFLLGVARIWERRRHGGGFNDGGGPPAELKATVASSWAAAAACSGLGAELGQQRARGAAAGDLGSPSYGPHVPHRPLCACEGGGSAGDSLKWIVIGHTTQSR